MSQFWLPRPIRQAAAVAVVDDKIYSFEDASGFGAVDDAAYEESAPTEWYADDNTPNRANNLISNAREALPESYEWEDPEQLDDTPYQLPWSQAPPIDDNLVALGTYYPDEAEEPEDEDYGFTVDAVRPGNEQGSVYYPDEAEEPEDEDYAFADGPLADDAVAVEQPQATYYPDEAEEPEDEDFAFASDPLAGDNDLLAGSVLPEQSEEPEDEDFSFADGPLSDNAAVVEQPNATYYPDESEEPEDEDFGAVSDPLASDNLQAPAPQYADEAEEPEDEPHGFEAGPQPDSIQSDQVFNLFPDEAEEAEDEDYGFAAAPTTPELVIDEPLPFSQYDDDPQDVEDDESYGFSVDPTPEDVIPPIVVVEIIDGGVPTRKKTKHPRREIEELIDEVVRERETPPPVLSPDAPAIAENRDYQIVPVYKPSVDAIPLKTPAGPPPDDDEETISYLVSMGLL
jgi:hypothetical protein